MATVDELDFKLILDDSQFNEKIKGVEERAEKFNATISQFLEIQSKITNTHIDIDTKEAENSLERLNEYFRQLEAADWTKIGEKINVTPQVEQIMLQLRALEEEIEVIQALRAESGGNNDFSLAEAYKQASEQARNLTAAIAELRQAEKALNQADGFREYIESITSHSFEYEQLVNQLREEEKESARLQAEKEEEAKAREKAARAAEKERAAREKLVGKQVQGEFEEYIKSLTEVNDELRQMGDYYRQLEKDQNAITETGGKTSRIFRELAGLATSYFSVYGAERFLKKLVEVSSEFEFQRTTLRAILRDTQGADTIFEQMKGLAVVSPFSFRELVTYVKQLSAYSIPMGELYDTTKMLADVSAGLGVDMNRLVLAYGQVRSAAFLRGQEVRQFTEAGIPILDELAKQFEEIEGRVVTTGEVFDKISKRQVPFEMVARVFKDMTSEGGKFYEMQEVQAETLKGRISNLVDAYEIMFSEIGQKTEGVMKGAVGLAASLAVNYKAVGETILELVGIYGVARVATVAWQLATARLEASNLSLAKGLKAVGKWIKANPYALLAAAVAALVTWLIRAAKAQDEFEKVQNKFENEYAVAIEKESIELERYFFALKNAKQGTKEYDSAKKALFGKYSTYIEQLRAEGVDVNNLSVLYDTLSQKIEASIKARLRAASSKDIEKTLSDAVQDARDRTKRLSKRIGGNEADTELLWQIVTGGYTKEQLDSTVNEYAGVLEKIRKKEDVYVPGEGTVKIDGIWGGIRQIQSALNGAKNSYNEATLAMEKFFGEVSTDAGTAASTITPDTTEPEKASKEAIRRIESRISVLEKLKGMYDEMRQYYSDDDIREFFSGNFGFLPEDMRNNLNFDSQISALIGQLDKLGTEGVEAANKVRMSIGEKMGSSMVKTAEDMKKAEEEAENARVAFGQLLRDLFDESSIEGSGATFKLSQIVAKYEDALREIDKKTDEARQKLYDKANKEKKLNIWSALGFAADYNDITGRSNAAKSNALAQYSEEGRKAIETMYKEWRDGAVDFNNLSDKSINQLKKMRDAIEKVGVEDIVPKEQQELLAKLGIDLKTLQEILKGFKDEDLLGKLFPEIKDDTADRIKYIAEEILNCAAAVREFAEEAGKDKLASAMESIQGVAETAKAAAEGFSRGGAIGAVIGGLSQIFQNTVNLATEAVKLKTAIASAADEAERFNVATQLAGGVDSLFGTNAVQSIRNAVSLLKEYKNAVSADNSREGDRITWMSGFYHNIENTRSLRDMVRGLGYDLYNEYGSLNTEALQAVLDTYETLASADRAWIEDAIRHSELYQEAMEALNSSIQDTWGNLADSLADKLITARTEIGDAYAALADDLRATFGDMADDIARKLVSSFIVDNVLAKYAGDLKEIYLMMGGGASNDEIATAFAALANNVVEDAGIAADFTNKLYDAFERAGVDIAKSTEGASNLSEGIKGITEDTANLLASYLNAIRADVAKGCIQRDGIMQYVERIASYVATPTLMDHLNKIQANTYDTAVATQGILASLQSVITSENGPMAVRILS